MPQDVGDILHRRAGAQKPTGHAMPQDMDPCAGPSTSSVACQNRAPDDALLDRFVVRGDVADKYGPVRGLGPLLAQIGGDRAAGRRGQGEDIGAPPLGSDKADRPCRPS